MGCRVLTVYEELIYLFVFDIFVDAPWIQSVLLLMTHGDI